MTSSDQQSEDQQSYEFRNTPDQTSSSLNDQRDGSSKPSSNAGDELAAAALAEISLEQQMARDEELHKKNLQLYVFILRSISYPFNSKQPTDMARRLCKELVHIMSHKVKKNRLPSPL